MENNQIVTDQVDKIDHQIDCERSAGMAHGAADAVQDDLHGGNEHETSADFHIPAGIGDGARLQFHDQQESI